MNQADNSRWRRVRFWLLVGAVIFFVNNLIIFSGMNNGPGINKVTVWDWVGVLIIPVGLLIAGIWINAAQVRREETVASHRAQDEAVQTYLRDMSELVIKHHLRAESPDPDICKVAQARTVAVLLVLDAKRKRHTLRLVYELGLINRDEPVIDLKNADLNKADLPELALPNACLKQVDLRGTDLSGSNLKGCNLSKADLRGADLTNVDLSDADLTNANLLPFDEGEPAKMSIHNLRDREVDSTEAETEVDGLLPNVKKPLKKAPRPSNLSNTNLEGANLSGAILANTDLRTARGLTNEQIEHAIGNQTTRLPKDFELPEAWKEPIEEQIEMWEARQEESATTA